jgi:hypothetical protein
VVRAVSRRQMRKNYRCWQETTRPYRRRLLQAFSFVLGVIVLAAVAYREGWEAVLFLLIFLAIWQLSSYRAGA